MTERSKQYYYANRERILENGKTKVECQCGCILSKSSLLPHQKTNKHMNYMCLIQKENLHPDDYIIFSLNSIS